jgi:RNA polymerase sigma-70 factor (ECF subfamily)
MSAHSPPARGGSRREPTRDERRLAARLRRRERAALAGLYERHAAATFGFLLGALHDRDAAEDVQQQVFLEAWQRGPSYDPTRASPLTWLMMIARSRAIDHLRRRRPEPRDPASIAEIGTSGELDDLHESWWLAGVLRELPEDEAVPLRLRFAHGLTQVEIAAALELPLGTVKSRMSRALARLRPVIEQHQSELAAIAKEQA